MSLQDQSAVLSDALSELLENSLSNESFPINALLRELYSTKRSISSSKLLCDVAASGRFGFYEDGNDQQSGSSELSLLSVGFSRNLDKIEQIINFFEGLIIENPRDTAKIAEIEGFIEFLNEIDENNTLITAYELPILDQYGIDFFAARHQKSNQHIRERLSDWAGPRELMKQVKPKGRWIITDYDIAQRFDTWLSKNSRKPRPHKNA